MKQAIRENWPWLRLLQTESESARDTVNGIELFMRAK
jgi:hypothetical protein